MLWCSGRADVSDLQEKHYRRNRGGRAEDAEKALMLLKAITKARRAFKRRFFNSSSRLVRSAVALSAAVTVFSLAPASAAGQAAPGQAGGCPNDSAHFHPCAMAKAKAFKGPQALGYPAPPATRGRPP